MIKVEIMDAEDDKTMIFFEATKPEDRDTLDRLLEVLAGPYAKRGGFVMGAPNLTLRIEAKITK